MRTRSQSDSKSPVTIQVTHWTATGSCTTPMGWTNPQVYTNTYVPWELTRTMHDVVTPSWNLKRNSGEIVNNPYDIVEVETTRTPINWSYIRTRYTYATCNGVRTMIYYEGSKEQGVRSPSYLGTSYLTIPNLTEQNVIDLAVTGSWAKANETDAQGLVILAEGEKTIHSLTSITGRLLRICKAIKQLKFQKLAREFTPKELSDRWMEGRYAIRPLVYDMCDVVKAINRDRTIKQFRQTYRSGATDSGTATQSGVTVYTDSTYGYLTATKTSSRYITAKAGVLAAIESVSEATIWGLNRPFEAMWELVPFSFVVDWFLNVGKVISSWSPMYGARALASWVVVENTTLESIVAESGHLGSWTASSIYENQWNMSGGSIVRRTTTKKRLVNPNRPLVPTFNLRLDAAKLLDLGIMCRRFLR